MKPENGHLGAGEANAPRDMALQLPQAMFSSVLSMANQLLAKPLLGWIDTLFSLEQLLNSE